VVIVSFLNIFLLGISLVLAEYTGVSVLEGKIIPEETFKGDFILNNTKDLTFIFEANYISKLTITITDPNGNISTWKKEYSSHSSSRSSGGTVVDATMILTPQLTGKYHIEITGAKSPINLRIKSGMINPIKNGLIFVGVGIFWFVVLFAISRMGVEVGKPSKEEVFIALLISLVTIYATIYYSSI
jgi:uncharacterized YccA/Bax inhibitor family protein